MKDHTPRYLVIFFAVFATGAWLIGLPPARADSQRDSDELRRIRVALESIAESQKRCAR